MTPHPDDILPTEIRLPDTPPPSPPPLHPLPEVGGGADGGGGEGDGTDWGHEVFAVFRHVHGPDGRVARSRLRRIFEDPEDAESWRQRWTAEDMEFEELVESAYVHGEREGDAAADRGDPACPNPAWVAASHAAVEAWMNGMGMDDAARTRLIAADRHERARHYIEMFPVVPAGADPEGPELHQLMDAPRMPDSRH